MAATWPLGVGEHADAFFARIEVEMQRRSAHLAALSLVIIADGASWIWDRVADLAERGQQVWHILDFWHACEHLATIARWLYGEGSERCAQTFRRWRGMLRDSRGAEVIAELTTLRDSGEYPALRADIQGEIDYFTANQQRMDYRRYRELGLPIGSGTVESACKNVVAARMKQSSMMWGMPGATGMLQLRAYLKSRRFRSDTPHKGMTPFRPGGHLTRALDGAGWRRRPSEAPPRTTLQHFRTPTIDISNRLAL